MGTVVNLKDARKWLIKKDLYEFVLEMWDSYETSPYSDCWLVEFLCECYQYSIKHFLPKYCWDWWISDEEYERIKKEIGGKCPVRDFRLPDGSHTRNHDLNVGPRHMKLLSNDTPVLTRSGWKRHGDLVVGDEVINNEGKFVKVIFVHPKDVADKLITFSNGQKIKCNGEHLWWVVPLTKVKPRAVRTVDMQKDFKHGDFSVRGKHGYSYLVPKINVIEGEYKQLEVDPYVLGAWLGDGTYYTSTITSSVKDRTVISEIVNRGYNINKEWYNNQGWGESVQVNFENKLKTGLNKLGMCTGREDNKKFIPDKYLTASVEQRLELLAGLIDTDGSLARKEMRYFFCNTNKQLIDNVVTLVESFGWRATVKSTKYRNKDKLYYSVGFNPTFGIPCKIKHKQLNEFSKSKRISVINIEDITPEEGNCITVEGGIYLVGEHLVPTHNSSIMNVLGPAWTIINTPVTVTSVSHSKDLSGEMVVKKQKLFNSDKYAYYFGNDPSLKLVKNSATCLELRNGGKTYSIAMDKFTGFGSDIIINDDLISVADARRDGAVLLHARDYYKTTMPSRLNNKTTGVIWHIMQRIGRGDISDLIAEDKGLRKIYSHTEIQAIATHDQTFIFPCSGKVKEIKKGDLLWSERFGDYSQLKMEVGIEDFETQYNQIPAKSRLNVIQDEMIHYISDKEYEEFKLGVEFHYGSHDCPVKDKETSDFHGFTEAYSKANELVITDAFAEHMAYIKEKEYIKNLNIVDPAIIQIVEDKANGAALVQDLSMDVPGIVAFNPGTKSKTQRLELASIYMQQGLVRFRRTERVEELISHLKKFPLLEHDDDVDSFSQLVIYHFTQRQLGVYSQAFSYENIIDPIIRQPNVRVFINYGATMSKNNIKVVGVSIDNYKDEYVVEKEYIFDTVEKFENFCKNDVAPGCTVYDGSPLNRLSSLLTQVYNVIKFVETDRDKSINILKAGFYKKKVKVTRDCKQTINDIARMRITESSREKGIDQTDTLDEGMAGALRAVISSAKGNSQVWY